MERLKNSLMPRFGLLSWFLALFMTQAVLISIDMANWVDGFAAMRSIGFMAALVGGILACWRRVPAVVAHLVSLILAICWALLQMDFSPRLARFGDRFIEILIHAVVLTRDLQQGRQSENYYLFIFGGLILGWMLVYTTMWFLFRKHWSWRLVMLNGAVLMTNLTFADPKPNASFWFFLITALLVIVFENFRFRQRRWQAVALEQQEWLSLRFIWSGLVACIGLLLFASLLPSSITNAQLQQLGTRISKPFDGIQRSLGLPDSNPSVGGAQAPRSSTPNFANSTMQLGGARVATNEVVLQVQASKPEYWRSNAWDLYNGRGWENTTGDLAREVQGTSTKKAALTSVNPENTLLQFDDLAREPFTQTITLVKRRADQQLPAATMPYTWSVPILVEHTFIETPGGEAPLPNFTDSSIFYSQQNTTTGMTYTVVSLISTADKQSLRQSSIQYAPWTARYLQLPPGTATRRITSLANQIVLGAGATNPYDKAIAIETYLRQFPYDDQISSPPTSMDPIEYFLFDLQRGYCDYFATSMVLMLRAQGIPARWVQGYATGERDPETGTYLVRDTIAHSWPEVYFAGYGWQRFEPTPASYTTLPTRPEVAPFDASTFNEDDDIGPNGGLIDQPEALGGQDFEQLEAMREQLENQAFPTPVASIDLPNDVPVAAVIAPRSPIIRVVTWVCVVLALILLVLWALIKRESYGLMPAAKAMAIISQLARWGGYQQRPEHTLQEFAQDLGAVIPAQKGALERLAKAYEYERYSRAGKVDIHTVREDAQAVQKRLSARALRYGWRTFVATLLRQRARWKRKQDQE